MLNIICLLQLVKTGHYLAWLLLAVLFAAVSAYYYFKVIQAMYFKEGDVITFAPVTNRFKYLMVAVAYLLLYLVCFQTYSCKTCIFSFYFKNLSYSSVPLTSVSNVSYFMKLADTFALSYRTVRSNKLRTGITVAIIAFGIMALIGIITAIEAMNQSLKESFSTLGANAFSIRYRDRNINIGGGSRVKQSKKQ